MAVKKRPISPRQKMINLMYIVLMAMLALNVSSDVLKGFTLISESLKRTTDKAAEENVNLYRDFEKDAQGDENVRRGFDKAKILKQKADRLYDFIASLRMEIAREADGPDGDPDNLNDKETLTAAEYVMLSQSAQGTKLREMIEDYRKTALLYTGDPRQQAIVRGVLSTDVPDNTESVGQNWEQYMFEQMPAVAAVALLSKMQSDVRKVENGVLRDLRANANVQNFRVNDVRAMMVPNKTVFKPGEEFTSQIFMAALDTTAQPRVFINGRELESSTHRFNVGTKPGNYSIEGYALMPNIFGDVIRRDFVQHYTVLPTDPATKNTTTNPVTNISPHQPPALGTATLAADLMNVLYAGFDNPMSISVSGVDISKVQLSMTGGSLTTVGPGKYTARPAAVGQPCVFTVTGTYNGKTQELGKITFRTRKLPDPTAYITMGSDRFKGGRLAKGTAASIGTIHAAIDDGLLDIPFTVLGFEAVFHDRMGNSIVRQSAGASFTEDQRNLVRKMTRGQRFYIAGVRCVGPDKIQRTLPQAMQIIVQ